MSAVVLIPSSVIYREEQNFDWRVYATIAGLSLVSLATFAAVRDRVPALDAVGTSALLAWPFAIGVGLLLPVNFVFWILHMTTEVASGEVRIWFGWLPSFRRSIVIAAITRVEVVRFRPVRDHGGWGICHTRDGARVFSARGERGVRLDFADGSIIIIGSQKPELLAGAIDAQVHPAI